MEGQRGVEMIRLPREEEVYEREAVLGRDATSVFPTEAKAMASSGMDALKEAIGVKKFISESELESIKASRGASVEDGTMAADKPLAQVLAEARQKKEDDFQDKWKTMKQGKNRPLDDDEVEFLQQVAEAEAERLRRQREEEERELDAFRMAIKASQAGDVEPDPAEAGPGSRALAASETEHSSSARAAARAALSVKPLLSVKPSVIKVKPKQAAASTGATAAPAAASSKRGVIDTGIDRQTQPPHKRQHTAEAKAAPSSASVSRASAQPHRPQQTKVETQDAARSAGAGRADEPDALASLLGGYGSDSDGAVSDQS